MVKPQIRPLSIMATIRSSMSSSNQSTPEGSLKDGANSSNLSKKSTFKTMLPAKLSLDRSALYQLVCQLCSQCSNQFEHHRRRHQQPEVGGESGSGGAPPNYFARILKCTDTISDCVTRTEPIVAKVCGVMHLYDYSPECPGNGFRSNVAVTDSCLLHIVRLLHRILQQNSSPIQSVLFNARHHCKELEAYAAILRVLCFGAAHAQRFLRLSKQYGGQLIVIEDESDEQRKAIDEMMHIVETIDQTPFYGRAVGFQFVQSLKRPFQVIGIALASFSEGYESRPGGGFTQAAWSVLKSGKYVISPEERSERIVKITRDASIHFCKAFWNISESGFIQNLSSSAKANIAINELLSIPCDTILSLRRVAPKLGQVEINPPSVYSGTRPLPLRLLSSVRRQGMMVRRRLTLSSTPEELLPKSPYLVFHCHGGGFVAQSSRSHEIYLRHWAQKLRCPIVSLDYSLAPEYPYPRALEEAVYAYAWALNNASALGWTGERVVMVGDSAGGNLITATVLRMIAMGVSELPRGLCVIYGAFLIQYLPSPSRFMSLMDPLLPVGIVARCTSAYTGNTEVFDQVVWPPPPPPVVNGGSSDEVEMASEAAADGKSGAKKRKHEKAFRTDHRQTDVLSRSTSSEFTTPPTTPGGTKAETNSTLVSYLNFQKVVSSSDENRSKEREKVRFEVTEVEVEDDMIRVDTTAEDNDEQLAEEEELEEEENVELDEEAAAIVADESHDDLVDFSDPIQIESSVHKVSVRCDLYEDDLIKFLRENPVTSGSTEVIKPESLRSTSWLNQVDFSASREPNSCEIDSPTSPPAAASNSYLTGSIGTGLSSIGSFVFERVTDKVTGILQTPLGVRPSAEEGPIGARNDATFNMILDNGIEYASLINPEQSNPLRNFRQMRIEPDPFMSPLYAPPELLQKMPKMCLIGCHFDPLLDDTVEFARKCRLAGIGDRVHLDLLDGLPHGFLSLVSTSSECRHASMHVLNRVRQLLEMSSDESVMSTITTPSSPEAVDVLSSKPMPTATTTTITTPKKASNL